MWVLRMSSYFVSFLQVGKQGGYGKGGIGIEWDTSAIVLPL
jgi:hypothetical protein